MINPEEYTVSVRMESVDGERMYVARIQELPDVEEYADAAEFARELALDTIATMYEICQEKGLAFPAPNVAQAPEASGRVTLRLAKSIHASAIQRAQLEGISLNQFMSNAISSALVKADSFDLAKNALTEILEKYNDTYTQVSKVRNIRSHVLNYFTQWESSGVETETIIGTVSSEAQLGLGIIRDATRFGSLGFDEPSAPTITQAFKMCLPAESFGKSKRQPVRFIKAGAL
ncbi:toxin-antitoxin system HicB family antitoxin [Aeromonas salmonicida]|uniref:toxin-antitoxin system HicB family antitoxin n=1 Tax=Aeromonas salmonicida TaxID=645 RepID=UPI001BA4A9B0|nr:toxin-antitoxin system HicB family antitoxin [Aeromonas salmonicida]MBS2781752.1 toxin-antitoxin system HicB family antitoxin [Aeromonas salmonicida]